MKSSRIASPLRRAVLLVGLAATASCSLNDLLEVELPGRVTDEALNDPALAATLVRSVIADFECAWNRYVWVAAYHSDEYIEASGNLVYRNWGTRRIESTDAAMAQSTCASLQSLYTPLQTARFQGDDVYARIEPLAEASFPLKAEWLATTRAYAGYALVALGEGFCESAIDEGPILTPDEVLAQAEQRFTDAIALANQAGSTDLRNMALVGRARVRLDLENFTGARDDASAVPDGYLKVATRDGSEVRRFNAVCEVMNCAQPPRRDVTIAPSYRDVRWQGVPDPRVNVRTLNQAASDAVTIFYFHDKATSRADPVPIASYKEAQLILAEVAARTGDLLTARTIINARHTLAGIPGFDPAGTATQDEVIRQVIEERRRELFVEGGHRLNDHLRFRGTQFEIPFLGEPGSDHPAGVNHKNVPYANTTCIPLPDVERGSAPTS
ncbi:MAG: RagB/SusD family nutrient uptake outer membrane protein [Gemmatimonadales bacterium]